MARGEFFDVLEVRDPEAREEALMGALAAHVAQAKASAPYYARLLADIESDVICTREALQARLVTPPNARTRQTGPRQHRQEGPEGAGTGAGRNRSPARRSRIAVRRCGNP